MTGNKYNPSNKMRLSTKMDRRTNRERVRAAERYGQMAGTEDPGHRIPRTQPSVAELLFWITI